MGEWVLGWLQFLALLKNSSIKRKIKKYSGAIGTLLLRIISNTCKDAFTFSILIIPIFYSFWLSITTRRRVVISGWWHVRSRRVLNVSAGRQMPELEIVYIEYLNDYHEQWLPQTFHSLLSYCISWSSVVSNLFRIATPKFLFFCNATPFK